MKLDKFANPIFNETDVFDALYNGHQTLISQLVVEDNYELSQLSNISEIQFSTINQTILNLSIEEFDYSCQQQWFEIKCHRFVFIV